MNGFIINYTPYYMNNFTIRYQDTARKNYAH